MTFNQHEKELIERYEALRDELNFLDAKDKQLNAKFNAIDTRLVKIEQRLPDDYEYPRDYET